MKLWPRVCIFNSGVIWPVSPKSYRYSPLVSDGQAAGSTQRITGSIRPASFSRKNGNDSPPKFEPPPVQPTSRSGVSPTMANCFRASSPMIVWCSNTWFNTLPRAYRVPGSAAATATASLMAMAQRSVVVGVLGQQTAPNNR